MYRNPSITSRLTGEIQACGLGTHAGVIRVVHSPRIAKILVLLCVVSAVFGTSGTRAQSVSGIPPTLDFDTVQPGLTGSLYTQAGDRGWIALTGGPQRLQTSDIGGRLIAFSKPILVGGSNCCQEITRLAGRLRGRLKFVLYAVGTGVHALIAEKGNPWRN